MTKFSEAELFGMTIRESANDGSDFTNPSADYRRLFLGEDGNLYNKDSAGTVTAMTGSSGSVATDAIWDAAGDLAVGSGANTAARLAIGATNGMVLMRVSGAVAWALPSGHPFDYAEITSDASITATAEGSADNVVSGNSVTYDGSTVVVIEFFSPRVIPATGTVGRGVFFVLYDGASSIGLFGAVRTPATGTAHNAPVRLARRLTPSAAAHTYHIKAFVDAGTGTVTANTGGSGAYMPAYIRITKA